jgi:hypothetical protein
MKPRRKQKPITVGRSPSTGHDGLFGGSVLPRIGCSAQWLNKPSAELRASRLTEQDASHLTYERCIKSAALAAQIPQALLKVGWVDVDQDSRWNGLWRFGRPKPLCASSDSPLTLGQLRPRTSSTGGFGHAGLGVPRWQQHRDPTTTSAARAPAGAGARGRERSTAIQITTVEAGRRGGPPQTGRMADLDAPDPCTDPP